MRAKIIKRCENDVLFYPALLPFARPPRKMEARVARSRIFFSPSYFWCRRRAWAEWKKVFMLIISTQ